MVVVYVESSRRNAGTDVTTTVTFLNHLHERRETDPVASPVVEVRQVIIPALIAPADGVILRGRNDRITTDVTAISSHR